MYILKCHMCKEFDSGPFILVPLRHVSLLTIVPMWEFPSLIQQSRPSCIYLDCRSLQHHGKVQAYCSAAYLLHTKGHKATKLRLIAAEWYSDKHDIDGNLFLGRMCLHGGCPHNIFVFFIPILQASTID